MSESRQPRILLRVCLLLGGAFLASLYLFFFKYLPARKYATCALETRWLHAAINNYSDDYGNAALKGVKWGTALSGGNPEQKNYLEKLTASVVEGEHVLDAYGTPYVIKDVSRKGATVISAGANKIPGDEDDITQLVYMNALLKRSAAQGNEIKVRLPE